MQAFAKLSARLRVVYSRLTALAVTVPVADVDALLDSIDWEWEEVDSDADNSDSGSESSSGARSDSEGEEEGVDAPTTLTAGTKNLHLHHFTYNMMYIQVHEYMQVCRPVLRV